MFELFLDKENLKEKGLPVIPILLSCEFFDVAQTIMGAVFRGLGKQLSASILTFIQFYVVMTTISYVLGKIVGWGVYEMWVGINIGEAAAFIFYLIIFFFFDLNKIQIEVKKRLETDQLNARSFIENSENENLEGLLVHERKDNPNLSFDSDLYKNPTSV